MKTHFIPLLNYDRYTTDLMAQLIHKAGLPTQPLRIMSHLLTAQQVWFNRCVGLPPIGGPLWPYIPADAFADIIAQNSENWLGFVNGLESADFDRMISYKNLRGDAFENKLSDILAHLINHGTHHRAQIGKDLKEAGIAELPVTDYIAYIRQLNS